MGNKERFRSKKGKAWEIRKDSRAKEGKIPEQEGKIPEQEGQSMGNKERFQNKKGKVWEIRKDSRARRAKYGKYGKIPEQEGQSMGNTERFLSQRRKDSRAGRKDSRAGRAKYGNKERFEKADEEEEDEEEEDEEEEEEEQGGKSRMQIRVKCGCDRADCSDWALLELQGVLEIQPSAQHLPLHSLTLGSLCSPAQVPIANAHHAHVASRHMTLLPLSLSPFVEKGKEDAEEWWRMR
jgi:hypothetical protein